MAARIRGRLIGAHQRVGRRLVDFVLMPTEIHAVARIPAGDSVEGIARGFGNVISRWVRDAQPVQSHVLAGPYRAQCLVTSAELLEEIRMLAWRPVFQGLCATPSHYPLGGLRTALGLSVGNGFNSGPMLDLFGDPVPVARVALRRWIARRPSELDRRVWELSRGVAASPGASNLHAGAPAVEDAGVASLIAAGGTTGVDGALALIAAWVSVKIRPAKALSLQEASDSTAARGRALVACLAVKHRVCSAACVARYFGRAKATLSEQMAACRARPADQNILDTPLQRIVDEGLALRAAFDLRERP
jgi:hypothetical protein